MMGCDNYHIHILFPSSGERWVVRVPNTGHSSFPGIDVEYLYASEFATLRFLESTKVPAPKVFGYDVKSNPLNDVGVTYLMMEFLEGKPFDVMAAGEKVKKRALEGWADVLIELSRHPVGKACSLMPPRVQNCSNDGKTHQREDRIAMLRTKVTQPFGPFATAKEYYAGVVDIVLESAASGKIWSNFAVEAYLVYLEVRSNISTLLDNTNLGLETDGDAELFYLTHIDAKGDHIMLSPSGSVAAIIDWQGARFVPFREAFGPSLLTTDMHALYFGRPGISEDDRLLAQILREKGASDLADAMLAGDLIRRLHFGLGSAKSKDEMWDFVRGLLEALGVYGGESLESWRENALGKYGDDVGLERVFHGSARSFR